MDGSAAGEIGVVVSELALNALKHAYDGAQMGVAWSCPCREDDGTIVVTIQDHGPGLPDGFDLQGSRSGGLGLPVVAQAVGRLGGRLDAHTDGGAVFALTVPLDQSSSS